MDLKQFQVSLDLAISGMKEITKYNEPEHLSIIKQLEFIKSFADSGVSFKSGLIERRTNQDKNIKERFPTNDIELKNFINYIYDDLISGDYNVNKITHENSVYFFRKIKEKYLIYSEEIKNDRNIENINGYFYSSHFSSSLNGDYLKRWIMRRDKRTQFGFLKGVFSYSGQAAREIAIVPEWKPLSELIYSIEKFYTTDQSKGTNMYLDPPPPLED